MIDFRKERKEADYFKPLRVKCKCGHIMTFPAYVDTLICSWCGNKIKNNTKEYFKYKLRKEMKKND